MFSYFSAEAEADDLKLHHIQFQIVSTKRKIAPSRSWRRCFLLFFLRTGVKLHFYSLGTNLRRKHGVSRGEYPLGSGFPIGASSIPVGTRFCSAKSSVLYLLRPLTLERGCPTPDRHFPAAAEQADFVTGKDTKPGICHEQNPTVRV